MFNALEILSLGLGGLGFLLALLAYRLAENVKRKKILLICVFMVFCLAILLIVGYFNRTIPLR